LLSPYAERNLVTQVNALSLGSAHAVLGALASTLERWKEAIAHFEAGIEQTARMGNKPFTAIALRDFGAMYLRRGASGDREKGLELIDRAIQLMRRCEMDVLADKAAALKEQSPPRAATDRAPEPSALVNLFQCNGEYWTIGFEGKVVRLKDSKGLRDIAWLVRHPDQEIHVADLAAREKDPDAGSETGVPTSRSQGDPVLDDRARAEYRERIEELHSEITEAERNNDIGRVARLRDELDTIASVLGRAYGLGGRVRTAGDPIERIRKSVTFRIRDAIGRIERAHSSLGKHFRKSIKTGAFCSYVSDGGLRWSLDG
jgi:tetratricopeptide (TPR) repeat protein